MCIRKNTQYIHKLDSPIMIRIPLIFIRKILIYFMVNLIADNTQTNSVIPFGVH